ncbi:MAG: hypothetical protein AMXMBFR33_17550 [Candidatus Xenobia bacterium]
MISPPRLWPNGTQLQVRGTPERKGMVMEAECRGDNKWYYRIFFEATSIKWLPEDELTEPAQGHDPYSLANAGDWADPDSLRGFLTMRKLSNPLTDVLYSYSASRTDLLPHQFVPLMKLLDSPRQRLLIADEVGLGKTIEAGLILSELKTRRSVRRVLVVCQGSLLLSKWVEELGTRFDERFERLDRNRLLECLKELERDRDPDIRWVASLPLLRQDDIQEIIEESGLHFDLVIVDEAHRMRNAGTQTNELGQLLGRISDVLLFLTATPLHLGNEDLYSLLNILDPASFNDLGFFRELIRPNQFINQAIRELRATERLDGVASTLRELRRLSGAEWLHENQNFRLLEQRAQPGRIVDARERLEIERLLTGLNPLSHIVTRTCRRDVNIDFALRRPTRIHVTLKDAELDFLQGVENLARQVHLHSSFATGASFAVIMLRRQVASCLPGMVCYLRDILSNAEIGDDELDVEVDGGASAGEKKTSFTLPESLLPDAWSLLTQGESLKTDTKFDLFWQQLQLQIEAGQKKVVVFSFFRRTLAYLDDSLRSKGLKTFRLDGSVPPERREQLVEEFRDTPDPAVLLSSEVGGEGLDFQFASVMFNYDLPWNPMVVEQRIGRIDRYGQQSPTITIFNFSVDETIEQRIFEALYERIEIFERAIGDLEGILGEHLHDLTRDILSYKLTPEEEARKARQIADAIVRERQQLEELEQQAARVNDDGYFFQRIREVSTGTKFLMPEELQCFVEACIKRLAPGTKLVPSKDYPGAFSYRGADELRKELLKLDDAPQSRSAFVRVVDAIPMTLNATVANRHKRLEFLNARHPVIQALQRRADALGDVFRPAAAFECPTDGDAGDYLCFFHLLSVEGFRKDVSLICVPISIEPIAAHFELGESILQKLQAGEIRPWIHPPNVRGVIEEAKRASWDYVVLLNQRTRQAIADETERYLSIRRASLEATYQAQRAQVESRLRNSRNEKISRMNRAWLQRLADEHQAKLETLEKRRNIVPEDDLLAMALVRLVKT